MKLEKEVKTKYGRYKLVLITEDNNTTITELYDEKFSIKIPAFKDARWKYIDDYIKHVQGLVEYYEKNHKGREQLSKAEKFIEWDGVM